MELGPVDRIVLNSVQYAWFDSGYAAYEPSIEMLKDYRNALDSVDFFVVFGTWCKDSKREMPRFFKIMDELNFPSKRIELYGVDRSKAQPGTIPQQYHITNVPTIIVRTHGEELGRIVESPKATLEIDLLEILMNPHQ